MKAINILKKIKNQEWWIEETPANHQVAEWAWRGFIESSRYFMKGLLSFSVFLYKNGFVSEVTPRDQKIKQFYFALKKYKKDKKYLGKKLVNYEKAVKNLEIAGWKMIGEYDKLTKKELAFLYEKFIANYVEQARYSIFVECVDPFTEDILPEILRKTVSGNKENGYFEIASIMSAPNDISFMEKERILFLKGCLSVYKNKNEVEKYIEKLEKEYFWIATYYGGSRKKTAAKFKKEILLNLRKKSIEEIKKELTSLNNKSKKILANKKTVIKKYKLKQDFRAIFELISQMGELIDKRKAVALKATYILYRLMEKLEKDLKIKKELLAYTTYDEMTQWIKTGKSIKKEVLAERRKLSVYYVTIKSDGFSSARFITGKLAEKVYNSIIKIDKNKEIKGTVASSSPFLVKGRVGLVLNTSIDNFKKGDILVTSMTRPDFLPLMRRAKAIITDEGGLTCHAAIISRELGIPCIIGTKIATRMLKNGDLVEMDTDKGVVKIIK